MMADKRLYPLAILDEETQKRMEAYYVLLTERGYIGRQAKDIPYHFTLGDTDTANELSLLEQAEKICAETAPIPFRMDHVSLFGQSVLFLSTNVNTEMLELQSRFFPGCGEELVERQWCDWQYAIFERHGKIMTHEQIIDYCLKKKGSYLDYPFDPVVPVVRVKSPTQDKGRIFAQIFYLRG